MAVLGLNPHAGESGHLGREEIDVIEPVIRRIAERGARRARTDPRRHGIYAAVPRDRGCHRGHVPRSRSAGDQTRRVRQRGERHARTCRFCAPASITAPRCPWRAPAKRTPAACAPHLALAIESGQRQVRSMAVRKRFGQHFLHDPAIIRRIVDAVAPARGERIVEVGPGRGALTWSLLERAEDLDVIEIDRDLARALRSRSACRRRLARACRERARHRLRAPAGRRSAAADRRQSALQHLHAAAVSSAEPARRDRRYAFHAAEGGRRSHGREPRRQGSMGA